MFHLLPSPLSQKKKKYETSFQVSSFPFARVSDTSLAINTNCYFFFFFLDFVALTPSHDYFAYQKFRIPHQEIENPLLFFNVALNASNPQILYTVNSFFNCSSNLTYTLLHLYMYIYMCIHTYIRKPEEIQAETKEKSRISRIHKKKNEEERKKG